MNKEKTEYFQCSCYSEGLYVAVSNDEELSIVDIGFFSYGLNTPKDISLKHRLRHIWKIITSGTPYVDMVSLDQKTAIRLGEHLIKTAKERL